MVTQSAVRCEDCGKVNSACGCREAGLQAVLAKVSVYEPSNQVWHVGVKS